MLWTALKARWTGDAGGRELLRLAFPLILSNSFWTLQITIDRVLLSRYDSDAVGAAMAAVLLFWTPVILFQQTATYATTFVAQYVGAGRPERVGPAVWQAIHFSVVSGIAFLGLIPLADRLVDLGGHSDRVQELEIVYFQCLCFAALPTILTAAVSSFFAGRGDSWTVLYINAVGLLVNGVLDYLWIFGYAGFPALGIAGAGWATVAGTWASAILGLALFLRPQFRDMYFTMRGWRLERDLLQRLLRFGIPSGLQWTLDALAFTAFVLIIGRLGPVELSATSITFTINMVAFMPALGIGQAVTILVGQRLGQNRPDLAEKSTWTAFQIAWLYMALIALLYVLVPQLFLAPFAGQDDTGKWENVAAVSVILLRFVAVYSVFDSMNLIFSFALKGAGDTRFVTATSLLLSWPLMVVPTWATWRYEWGLEWAWSFASGYVVVVAFVFLVRFVRGKWKSMRVIETALPQPDELAREER